MSLTVDSAAGVATLTVGPLALFVTREGEHWRTSAAWTTKGGAVLRRGGFFTPDGEVKK